MSGERNRYTIILKSTECFQIDFIDTRRIVIYKTMPYSYKPQGSTDFKPMLDDERTIAKLTGDRCGLSSIYIEACEH